ncbi:50S ribosomal protein L21 [Gloeocapsopsis dulcis]|uniref:Large ribosomal subunit protein bL21 n=1 Tax=Gloeocapsopsis dulcis AAB1 = 1H9 TaxID=1433147 RepID=A0A6N8G1E6_9CHRO|nr:50S ribosomal protein L21 [Gloeocapsopsis dulcis]MUL39153.1 50S ribosomal protein L21 [Gloeocapsopsis dulcis AAB1 = 1H9]WNN91824.1 50S ribosomal protein L21 [Gloeocapsopsis dulcis]
MTYAIIETGGKQLRVEPGRFYDIERLSVEQDEKVTLDSVLFVQHDDGIAIGQPFVDGASVEGTVLRHLRDRKILVYKMKPKKKTRKKRGHRQEITRLMIDAINLNGSVFTSDAAESNASTVAADEPEVDSSAETADEAQ